MKKIICALALLCTIFCLSAGAQNINKKNDQKTRYHSVFDMLRGQPGVSVGADAGAGGVPNIIIRGVGTNSGQTQPIFVVDDVRTENVSYINPDDVYSIEVLKDGTSAIYGIEGANGVIIITTNEYHRMQEDVARQAREAKALKKAEAKAAKAAKKAKK